jgi:hypothetical protein
MPRSGIYSTFCAVSARFSLSRRAARRLTPAQRCTQAYEQHLREARGLARAMIVNYVPFIRSFLQDLSATDLSPCPTCVPATS